MKELSSLSLGFISCGANPLRGQYSYRPRHTASMKLFNYIPLGAFVTFLTTSMAFSLIANKRILFPWSIGSFLPFHQAHSSHLFFHSLLFLLSTNHTELLASQMCQLFPNIVLLKCSSLYLDYSLIK